MARQPIEIRVTTSGFLFTPKAVASVHRSIYDALDDVATAAASAAAGELYVGHGVLPYAHKVSLGGGRYAEVQAGALQASIEPRRKIRHTGGVVWTGQSYVIQGGRGFEPVRMYGAKINKLYRQMYRGGAAGQAYANANGFHWATRMAGWLSRP